MRTRRIIAAVSCVLIAAIAAVSAGAALISPAPQAEYNEYGSMLVLGDSITTGYGLANYTPGGTPYNCASYANRLAAALGLKGGDTYINKAVNGDKTSDLRALLPSLKSTVEKSGLIVISIGGNNLLQNLGLLAAAVTGKPVSGLESAAAALSAASEDDFTRAMQDPAVSAVLAKEIAGCGTDVTEICKMIREYNPGARTVFLLQYNPAAGVATLKGFDTFASMLIGKINEQLTASVSAAGSGFELADVPSVINDAAAAKTNILQMDIHPNAAGHGEIYKLLLSQLNIRDPEAAPAETQPEETTEEETTAAETTAEETSAENTADGTDTTASESSGDASEPGDETGDSGKKGCGSSVQPVIAAAIIISAGLSVRKKRD